MTIRVHTVKGRFPVLPSHVNAYVVELPEAAVIVDATAAISSANELRQRAEATGKPLQAVLMTHGHPDHFTGLVAFADLPRYASQGCIDFAHREDEEKWESGKMYLGDDFPDARVFPDQVVTDGAQLTLGGVTFTFHDLGGGESDADGLWWFEADGVKHAFVGDVIGHDMHSFFGDGHALHWLEILDRLERDFDADTRFYIGHGDSPVGIEQIGWQRRYIQTFLDAVRAEERVTPVPQETLDRIMARMQAFLPSEALFFLLGYELEKGVPRVWQALDRQPSTARE